MAESRRPRDLRAFAAQGATSSRVSMPRNEKARSALSRWDRPQSPDPRSRVKKPRCPQRVFFFWRCRKLCSLEQILRMECLTIEGPAVCAGGVMEVSKTGIGRMTYLDRFGVALLVALATSVSIALVMGL